MNLGKREKALMAGGDLGRGLKLPGSLQWKTGGIWYLGVFLGAENFMGKTGKIPLSYGSAGEVELASPEDVL